MNESTNKATIYRKIAAVAGAIEPVEKDGRNKDQGYRYPTPASVMQAVKPLMAAQGLALVPHLLECFTIDTGTTSRSGTPYTICRVSMHYHILDGETGESIVVPWQAQAGTYGDDKGLAKAQTIALRTFLIQLFQIPAEDEDTDPDRSGPAPQARAQTPQPAPPQTTQRATQNRAAVTDRIRQVWAEEKALGGTAPASEVAIDLDNAHIGDLITLGCKIRARVDTLKIRKEEKPPAIPKTNSEQQADWDAIDQSLAK